MSHCYELSHTGPLQSTTYDDDGHAISTNKSGSWLFVPEEAEEKLDLILAPYDRTGDGWLFAVGQGVQTPALMPFALVCFNREYRVTGHILEAKRGNRSLGISTYGHMTLGEIPASIGCLHVFGKGALEEFRDQSPVLAQAWQTLSEKPDSKSWLVILDPFKGEWIHNLEQADQELLETVLAEGGAPTPVSEKDID